MGLQPGFVIFSIVELPMLLLVLAALLGRPRKLRVTAVFVGALSLLFMVFLAATLTLGTVLSLIIPA